jgi:hypothetical protein
MFQLLVFDCETAYEVWKALCDELHNLDKVTNVRLVYDTLSFVEGTPMRYHINKLRYTKEQLSSMGNKIRDLSHALCMIRLLPLNWEVVGQALWANKPIIAKVKDRLLAEEQYRKTQVVFANTRNASALLSHTMKDANVMASVQAIFATQFGSTVLNLGQAMNAPAVGRTTKSASKNSVPNPKQSQPAPPKKQGNLNLPVPTQTVDDEGTPSKGVGVKVENICSTIQGMERVRICEHTQSNTRIRIREYQTCIHAFIDFDSLKYTIFTTYISNIHHRRT